MNNLFAAQILLQISPPAIRDITNNNGDTALALCVDKLKNSNYRNIVFGITFQNSESKEAKSFILNCQPIIDVTFVLMPTEEINNLFFGWLSPRSLYAITISSEIISDMIKTDLETEFKERIGILYYTSII